MLNDLQYKSQQVSGTVLAASRQAWLAGLGAAVVTREWAEREAGTALRTLVKEGTAVESKAFRMVGNRVETSLTRANVMWRNTRATIETIVRTYADTASALVRQTLPKAMPIFAVASQRKAPAVKSARAKRVVKTRAAKTGRRVKRTAKSAKR